MSQIVRMVVEAEVPDDLAPRAGAEAILRNGSAEARIVGLIINDQTDDERSTAAGDNILAVLLQHYPRMTSEAEDHSAVVSLVADILGGVLAHSLVSLDENEGEDLLDETSDRVRETAHNATAAYLRQVQGVS